MDENSTGSSLFDASQYAFFGNEIVEEVELGGLEDDEVILAPGIEEGYRFEQEERDESVGIMILGALSGVRGYRDFSLRPYLANLLRNSRDQVVMTSPEMKSQTEIYTMLDETDDLAGAFSTLNKATNTPSDAGLVGGRGSRESSPVVDVDYPTWYDQPLYNPEDGQEGKGWSSQPYASPILIPDSEPLHRTSSHPEPHPQHQFPPQRHQNFSSEPIPAPRTSFPSYPPPGGPHMVLPNSHLQRPNSTYITGGPHMGLHSQAPLSGPMAGLAHSTHFGPKMQHFSPPDHSLENHLSSQWSKHSDVVNNMLPPHGPRQNGLMPSQVMGQHQPQYRLYHPSHPPYGHLPGMHNQLYGHQLSQSPPMLNKFDAIMSSLDIRDQSWKSSQTRQNARNPQYGFDSNSSRGNGGWPVYRSRYMTAYEIENILRMQLAATHSNDPYVEDYYHQACLFKQTANTRLKHHFCPTQLRDLPSRARPIDGPHPFLQVEALGRVPFSSIRRPKPLLDVEPPTSTASSGQKIIDKPLDQEPMLAARVTIEDCLCLLLDVDDIDRLLQFNQFPDGGAELRQRRQNHLEGVAASLQLVDPLVKGRQSPEDDLIFLRMVSLPKGHKLLSKYLGTLSLGSELLRIVMMAIFRHLRFLFGVLPTDPAVIQATDNLVNVILSRVNDIDLNCLSSCLAAVVCSSEQPPLRPIGSSTGDGASVVLKSVLDRATTLVQDANAASSHTMPNQTFWKASFDEFFNLLLKYCFSKYESIVIGSDAARTIKKEMPVDLLRASLPHISEHQQKLLIDLAQKSVP